MDNKKMVQLHYCLRTANDEGIYEHPQKVMKQLGYNLIQSVPQSIGDCWWFTVEELIEPLPLYLSIMQYDFEYWQ